MPLAICAFAALRGFARPSQCAVSVRSLVPSLSRIAARWYAVSTPKSKKKKKEKAAKKAEKALGGPEAKDPLLKYWLTLLTIQEKEASVNRLEKDSDAVRIEQQAEECVKQLQARYEAAIIERMRVKQEAITALPATLRRAALEEDLSEMPTVTPPPEYPPRTVHFDQSGHYSPPTDREIELFLASRPSSAAPEAGLPFGSPEQAEARTMAAVGSNTWKGEGA